MAKLTSFDLDDAIGSFVIDDNMAKKIAREMLPAAAADLKQIIISHASAEFTSSQASILSHIQDIGIGGVEQDGDGFTIGLSLGGGLSRPSLNPYGSGVNDIVALFVNGWTISKGRPWGTWHGMTVGARMSKPGMSFLSSAVDEFNAKYAGRGIQASIGDGYG